MALKPYVRRVHYYETDKMKVVHHSNYIRWFEEARVDVLEQLGIGYDVTESYGVISPVVAIDCEYKEPTYFNERVEILCLPTLYTGVRLCFRYEVRSLDTGSLCATGHTEHCFTLPDMEGHPLSLKRRMPDWHQKILASLRSHCDDVVLRD